MESSRPTHPSPQQLAAFGLGRLDATLAESISSHITLCTACRAVVEQLPDDDLAALVRGVGGSVDMRTRLFDKSQLSNWEQVAKVFADHPRYRIEELIGEGGMGIVCKARHRIMERTVALKIMHPHVLKEPEAEERFRREVKTSAALHHPNIVTAFDADRAGDCTFLVMEYVPGASLAQHVREQGPMPVPLACDCIRQASLGLQYASEQGMTHRDIKPANLMRTPQGQVKILDFGLARLREDAGALTSSNVVMGTPDYLAPEQADDPRAADVRSDLYSLGCVLYFLLTAKPPFPDCGVMQKLRAHAERMPTPVTQFRSDVPQELMSVLNRVIAKEPAKRFQSPAELISALKGVSQPPAKAPSRKLPRVLLIALLAPVVVSALAIVVFLIGLTFHSSSIGKGEKRTENSQVVNSADGKTDKGTESTRLENSTNNPPAVRIEEAKRIPAHAGRITAIAMNPDGNVLATVGNDGFLRLWDLPGLTKRPVVEAQASFFGAAFSAKRDMVAAAGYNQEVICWNYQDGSRQHALGPWGGAIRTIAFSPNGQLVYAGGDERRVRCFDLSNKTDFVLVEFNDIIRCLAVTPNGQYLAVGVGDGNSGGAYLVDTRSKDSKPLEGAMGEHPALALDWNGTHLAGGGMAKQLKIWNVPSGKLATALPGPHEAPVMGVAYSSDGRRLVSVDGFYNKTEAPCSLKWWDVERAKLIDRFDYKHGCFFGVVLSKDGQSGYAAMDDGTVRQFRLPKETGTK
jgi:serine/threonine protein kinase